MLTYAKPLKSSSTGVKIFAKTPPSVQGHDVFCVAEFPISVDTYLLEARARRVARHRDSGHARIDEETKVRAGTRAKQFDLGGLAAGLGKSNRVARFIAQRKRNDSENNVFSSAPRSR